jgi:hypothetical protein
MVVATNQNNFCARGVFEPGTIVKVPARAKIGLKLVVTSFFSNYLDKVLVRNYTIGGFESGFFEGTVTKAT